MRENQAELVPAVERVLGAIDPGSTVPVSVQLRGALEFGVASGELPAGARLPSVRGLAARLGISPVTVSNVYATLQVAGHVEGRAGSGTYVGRTAPAIPAARLRELDAGIAALVRCARDCGLGPAELGLRISMAAGFCARAVRILMLGNFHDATEAYAAEIRRHLSSRDEVSATTIAEAEAAPMEGIDLVVAPRTLLNRAAELFPDARIAGLTLIPNEATRVALASIRPEARVVAYSYFPGFVTIMKTGILRFAPHVADLAMVVRDEPGAEARIAASDVLIYATGAEYLRDGLRPDQTAFEYRHTADAHAIRTELLPAIEACRASLASREGRKP